MISNLKILVISGGEFSGTKNSLISGLRQQGCDVIEAKSTLRNLRLRPLHALSMIINAIVTYKSKFRRYMNRTYASYVAYSKANNLLVQKYNEVDAVILIGACSSSFWKYKHPDTLYTIFTDHTNLLSKKLPDYTLQIPEKSVDPTWNKIEQEILLQQDHLFVMSSHVKRSMIEDYGVDSNCISVVGGGPNLDIDIERDGVKKNYGARKILFVGLDRGKGYVDRKGLKLLEKAFLRVVKTFPDATLHVVGVDGVSADRIIYHGKMHGELLKKVFYESQVFALPAFRESFGIVLLEAMWAKNVCIGTNIEAIPEIIEDGGSGYLVEPGDDEALADNIIMLFHNPSLLKEMAERGYQLAQKRWTWKKSIHSIIQQITALKFQG